MLGNIEFKLADFIADEQHLSHMHDRILVSIFLSFAYNFAYVTLKSKMLTNLSYKCDVHVGMSTD